MFEVRSSSALDAGGVPGVQSAVDTPARRQNALSRRVVLRARRSRWPHAGRSPRTRRSSPRTFPRRSSPRAARRSTTRSGRRASPSSRARRRPRATCASARRTTSTTSAASRCRTRTCSSTGRAARATLFLPHRNERRERAEGKLLSAEDAELVTKLSGVDAVSSTDLLGETLARFGQRGATKAVFVPLQPAEGLSVSRDGALRAVGGDGQRPLRRPARRARAFSCGTCATATPGSRSGT